MRAYFVNSELQGCYFVRCLLPLQANGWDGDQVSIYPTENAKTDEVKARAAQVADVVVFHRPDDPNKLKLAKLLKNIGKKIVFDNDDTLKDDGGFKFNKFMDKERMKQGMEKMDSTIDEFIKISDLVTCSTDFLKQEYQKLNPNVVVLPNTIDPFYFDEPLKNDTDVVRIGLVGSLMVTADLDVIKPIFEHFNGRKDIKFVIFSLPPSKQDKVTRELYYDEYKFLDTLSEDTFEWQPFVPMDKYYSVLNNLRLDLAIIPRKYNYFNQCKSNIKFLEMSMLEIPCLSQSFPDGTSPYEVNSEDAKHQILVKDNWIEAIENFAKDRKLQREMGKKAKEYVMENYDINKKGHLWEDAYKNLYRI